MRTKTLLLTAALTAAGIASSMAQVYSVNAVGYVNVTLQRGYNLIANPLNNGGNTLMEILPATTPLPDGVSVSTWDSSAGTIGAFDTDSPGFYPGFGWDPAGPPLTPGRGFYLYIPPSAPNATYTVTFVGEVPQGNLSTPLGVSGRYSAVSSAVPQGGTLTTVLGLTPADGDTVLLWDSTKNPPAFSDTLYVYNEGFGWNDGSQLVEPALAGPGEGFFLLRSAAAPTAWTRTFSVNP